jgi:hypothetical protein
MSWASLRQPSLNAIRPEWKLAETLSCRIKKRVGDGSRHRRQRRFSRAQRRQFGMVEEHNVDFWHFRKGQDRSSPSPAR